MGERFRPFSNGSEYIDWLAGNCDLCTKGYDHEAQVTRCDLEEALSLACVDDGKVPRAVAERIGIADRPYPCLVGRCREYHAGSADPTLDPVPAPVPLPGQLSIPFPEG